METRPRLNLGIMFRREHPPEALPEFARQVERKYRDGFLHAVSVGWDTIELDGRQRYDLLDLSAVPVPGDPSAIMERAAGQAYRRYWKGLSDKGKLREILRQINRLDRQIKEDRLAASIRRYLRAVLASWN